jgi:hypothetical protein
MVPKLGQALFGQLMNQRYGRFFRSGFRARRFTGAGFSARSFFTDLIIGELFMRTVTEGRIVGVFAHADIAFFLIPGVRKGFDSSAGM